MADELNTPSQPSESAEPTKPMIHGIKRSTLISYLVILLVLLIACIVVTFYHKQIFDSSQSAQVSITHTQFLPQTIDVKAGSDVTWTNNDSIPHQVAADPYPKDNSIPGFDNQVVLGPHETLTYKFETKGTYTYHDETNPYQLQGTVIVK